MEMRVAPGNQSFVVQGNMLLTSDRTEIVRYFGREREVFVAKSIEILRKSCFECTNQLETLLFENGSKLRKIGPSALCDCLSLTRIAIPASVEVIEESAFKNCVELEQCAMDENARLVSIEREAFAECHSIRSFEIPGRVRSIGQNCFRQCPFLCRLRCRSSDSVRDIVGDLALNQALENLGFRMILDSFRINVEKGGAELKFAGWVSVADSGSHLTLVRVLQ
jgi:hypothetical protein